MKMNTNTWYIVAGSFLTIIGIFYLFAGWYYKTKETIEVGKVYELKLGEWSALHNPDLVSGTVGYITTLRIGKISSVQYGGSDMDIEITMRLCDYENALASDWKIQKYFPNNTILWKNIITEEVVYTGDIFPPNTPKSKIKDDDK